MIDGVRRNSLEDVTNFFSFLFCEGECCNTDRESVSQENSLQKHQKIEEETKFISVGDVSPRSRVGVGSAVAETKRGFLLQAKLRP